MVSCILGDYLTKFTERNKTKLTISESLSRHSFQMAYFLLYHFLQVSVHSASVRLRMVKGHIKLSLEMKSKWGPKERSSKVMFPPVSSREEWVDNYRLRWKQRTTKPISSQWRMSLEKYKAWNGTTTQNFWFTGYLASFYVCMNSYSSWNIEFLQKDSNVALVSFQIHCEFYTSRYEFHSLSHWVIVLV